MELYRKVFFWIVQHYLRNPNLRILKEELRLGADSTEIFSKFYAVYKITPMGMVKERRLKYACKQLSQTTDSISMIADAMYCRTVEHFEAEFSGGMGMSPLAFRLKMSKAAGHRKVQRT